MTIYENNKQLLTTIGGNANNYSTDFEVRKAILDTLGGNSSMCSNIYEVDLQILKIFQEGGGAGGEKAKVYKLEVNNDCIVDGTWNADVIDTSTLKTMYNLFSGVTLLTQLDLSGWDVSNVTNMNFMFEDCSSLQSVGDISNWDVSNVTNMSYMFYKCASLSQLDLTGWYTTKVSNIASFSYYSGIINYVGGRTIDEVISNNITILNGLNVSGSNIMSNYADRASLRALINGLADRTGQTSLNLSLISTLKAKLTEEDIAVATAKNWTIS